MNFVKGFFIFFFGLVLGIVLFTGDDKSSKSLVANTLETQLDQQINRNARQTHHFQQADRLDQPVTVPTLTATAKKQNPVAKKPDYYNPDAVYADANALRDQTPTAPPTSYQTATHVPEVAEIDTEEDPNEGVDHPLYVPDVSDRDDLQEELKAKMQELNELKKLKAETNTASFSSFGMYSHIYPEEKKPEESNGGGAVYGGGGSIGGGDVGGSDVLPHIFTVAGVNTANRLLSKNSLTMPEYIDYISLGLASESESSQRLAVTNLTNKLHADAFLTLAQYSSTASSSMNEFLDAQLAKQLKNSSGLKFLSQQISNTESLISSQLAVNTVGLILDSEVPSNLFDVLVNDVLHSLNNLPANHPSYGHGRQLSALIPEIVNS